MKITNALFASALVVVACAGPVACTLGGDIDEVGESCRSDFDCPEDMECVPAESPNATRVCMDRLG